MPLLLPIVNVVAGLLFTVLKEDKQITTFTTKDLTTKYF